MGDFQTLKHIPHLKNKRVILRADLNVPLQEGQITDTTRIDRVFPTLKALLDQGAKVILISHLGRPKGQPTSQDSLGVVADYLKKQIPLSFCKSTTGPQVQHAVETLQPGHALLLENLRFDGREETNDETFAKEMADLGEIYVNDAFSVSHRAHMSVEAITHFLPSYAGLLMEKELVALDRALGNPKPPVMAIIAGAKVSTKLPTLKNLSHKVDILVIGGAMANTFLLAQGHPVGRSLVEADLCEAALNILNVSTAEVILPIDVVTAPELSPSADISVHSLTYIQNQDMILDMGPESIARLVAQLEVTNTVVINGPLGVFETPPFDRGTNTIFQKIAELTKHHKLTSVAGGGDTVAALNHAGVTKDISYISTAGGAFLEWLEGRKLPGVEALRDSTPF